MSSKHVSLWRQLCEYSAAVLRRLQKRLSPATSFVDAINAKHITILSAGIAYYGVLAFFPLIAAFVALASIFLQPYNFDYTALGADRVVPPEINKLLEAQLASAYGRDSSSALVAGVALLISLFSVSGAVNQMMTALTIISGDGVDRRSYVRQRSISLLLTIGAVISMVAFVPLVVVGRTLLEHLGLSPEIIQLVDSLRWVILVGMMVLGLGVLYHVGPAVPPTKRWRWLTPGAAIATAVWVVVTWLLFLYIQYSPSFVASYSLFAGIIALMLWLYASSYIVLSGAVINSRWKGLR